MRSGARARPPRLSQNGDGVHSEDSRSLLKTIAIAMICCGLCFPWPFGCMPPIKNRGAGRRRRRGGRRRRGRRRMIRGAISVWLKMPCRSRPRRARGSPCCLAPRTGSHGGRIGSGGGAMAAIGDDAAASCVVFFAVAWVASGTKTSHRRGGGRGLRRWDLRRGSPKCYPCHVARRCGRPMAGTSTTGVAAMWDIC